MLKRQLSLRTYPLGLLRNSATDGIFANFPRGLILTNMNAPAVAFARTVFETSFTTTKPYGAAGIWQAIVGGDSGIDPVYDWTTCREGMAYPGSAQLGLGKSPFQDGR
jgi:hypothetical protein